MAKFFIDRPIFAIVIALLIMLAGGLSIFSLPIEQYPPIAPPTVQISTTYPGASATTVQDTVVQVIEQQMSGLDHLLYMSSTGDDTGQSTTTLTFATGTNPDIAQVQVQNKLQLSGGQLGGTPAVQTQQLTAAIPEATLLRTPAQFENILLKVLPEGSQVRLRDVARVNLGAESFNVDTKYNGQPASGIGIQLAT